MRIQLYDSHAGKTFICYIAYVTLTTDVTRHLTAPPMLRGFLVSAPQSCVVLL